MTKICGNCVHYAGSYKHCNSDDWLVATRALRSYGECADWCKTYIAIDVAPNTLHTSTTTTCEL